MSEPKPSASYQRKGSVSLAVRLRLAGALVALAAGVAALVIAVVLVRSALG